MSNVDMARMQASLTFGYVAKYDGDRGPRAAPTGDLARDNLDALQADLQDPACVELVIFGDSFPTQTWRKGNGPDERSGN